MQVKSPSQLDFCDSENYFQAAPWRLLLIIPALECGKISPTDIDNQHLAPRGLMLWDCAYSKTHLAVDRKILLLDCIPLPLLQHVQFCLYRHLRRLDYQGVRHCNQLL